MNKVKLGEWLGSINYSKKNIMTDDNKPSYSPYIINRAMSNFVDTIFWANEMNRLPNLSKDEQYAYLLASVRKSKRYGAWNRPKKDKTVKLISEYYNCSIERAKEYSTLLTTEQIKVIEEKQYVGGTK